MKQLLLFALLCCANSTFSQTTTENFVLSRTYRSAGMAETNGNTYQLSS
jgi:hypothetical protein